MRDRELIVHAKLTLTAHRDAVVTLPAALAAAEFEALPLAAASYDKPLVAGGEGSDPTSSVAIAAASRRPDRTATLRCEIERSLAMIAVHVDIIAAAAREILEEHDPKKAKKRQQDLEDLAVQNGECCRSCHRTHVAPGVRRQEPKHAARFVDGEAWKLCKWCVRFADRTGRLPSIEEVEGHHDTTRRVRKPA